MSRASPANVDLAGRLIAHAESAGTDTQAVATQVYRALFATLTPIIGGAGVDALFARSVKLAVVEFPPLAELVLPPVAPDGDAKLGDYVASVLGALPPDAVAGVAVGMLAVLIGLLENFIGEALVWQIVRKAYPGIPGSQSEEESQ